MKKQMLAVAVALMAAMSQAACDKNDSPTAPSATTTPTTTATTPVSAFTHATGASVVFGRTSNAMKFSARLTGNLNSLIPRDQAFDWNGAQVDMYVYLSNGSRRKWTVEYGNSVSEGYRSTLFRDVDTDGAVAVVFQVYPYRAVDPIKFTFPYWDVAQYFRTSPGVSKTVIDGLHYLKAALPPVTSSF